MTPHIIGGHGQRRDNDAGHRTHGGADDEGEQHHPAHIDPHQTGRATVIGAGTHGLAADRMIEIETC